MSAHQGAPAPRRRRDHPASERSQRRRPEVQVKTARSGGPKPAAPALAWGLGLIIGSPVLAVIGSVLVGRSTSDGMMGGVGGTLSILGDLLILAAVAAFVVGVVQLIIGIVRRARLADRAAAAAIASAAAAAAPPPSGPSAPGHVGGV